MCHHYASPGLTIWLLGRFRLPGWVTEVNRTTDLSNIKGQKIKTVTEVPATNFEVFSIYSIKYV